MITYSLLFGLSAWALALVAIKRPKSRGMMVIGSFFLSAVSAIWQFFEIKRRADMGDFAGIEDTMGAIIIGVTIMMGVTLVLNFLALRAEKK